MNVWNLDKAIPILFWGRLHLITNIATLSLKIVFSITVYPDYDDRRTDCFYTERQKFLLFSAEIKWCLQYQEKLKRLRWLEAYCFVKKFCFFFTVHGYKPQTCIVK